MLTSKKRIKVLVEAKKLKNIFGGLGQVTLGLCQAFAKADSSNCQFTYYLPRKLKNTFGKVIRYKSAKSIYIKHPNLLGKYDIFLLTHPHIRMDLTKVKAKKIICQVLDLHFLFLDDDQEDTKIKWREGLQYSLDHSDFIVCISEYTKKLLLEHMQTHDKPITVIPLGFSQADNLSPSKPNIDERKFIFTLGTYRHKNIISLIRMMPYLEGISLIVGGAICNEEHHEVLLKLIKDLKIENQVKFIGRISDAEKIWCYQHCESFASPSLTEGFGMPPIEAMAFGKPVFVSDKTCLPEVCGPEAFYWEHFDPEYMANIYKKGMEDYNNDPDKANRLIQHTKKYSWDNSADLYIKLFKKIANENI